MNSARHMGAQSSVRWSTSGGSLWMQPPPIHVGSAFLLKAGCRVRGCLAFLRRLEVLQEKPKLLILLPESFVGVFQLVEMLHFPEAAPCS